MKLVPINIELSSPSHKHTIEEGFQTSFNKIYLARIEGTLCVVKRTYNEKGQTQFKAFDFHSISGMDSKFGRVFNNSDSLQEFVGAIVAAKYPVIEFDDIHDLLKNGEVLSEVIKNSGLNLKTFKAFAD